MSDLYSQMFQAKQVGNDLLAEALMIEMEKARGQAFKKPAFEIVQPFLSMLPEFCGRVLNYSQRELQMLERSNCINAAFNFHAPVPHWPEYTTMEFLDIVRNQFQQIPFGPTESSFSEFLFGDLLVIWSRTGGAWDNQRIDVHAIDSNHPDFPYGLVFDHVLICLSKDLGFHKADPTPQSKYEIDFISSILAPVRTNVGFELTLHRRSVNNTPPFPSTKSGLEPFSLEKRRYLEKKKSKKNAIDLMVAPGI